MTQPHTNWQEPANETPRVGILLIGMGAIATTLIAGVEAVRQGLGRPIGALTQLGFAPASAVGEEAMPLAQYLRLSRLDQLVFGGWDIAPGTCYDAAARSEVLDLGLLEAIRPRLEAIEPMPGVHDPTYLRRTEGKRIKSGSKQEQAEAVREDIRRFRAKNKVDQIVVMWCGSTEVFLTPGPEHQTLAAFEAALAANSGAIPPSMLYAWAALKEGCAFVNATPSLTVDVPALIALAELQGAPISGKDLKTGQTLLKTILAPGLKQRMLGIAGWFSMNILGNGDGAVLDDPDAFKSKEESKLSVLNQILDPDRYPELYGQISHQVKINYYPPRGDNKESWDNIDLVGWLGYPMQLKLNFLCRDSILAAPLLLDLALLSAAAQRAGMSGVQEWLGFYYKSPQVRHGQPEHDLSLQYQTLQQTFRLLHQKLTAAVGTAQARG